jgi:hypothetical protein
MVIHLPQHLTSLADLAFALLPLVHLHNTTTTEEDFELAMKIKARRDCLLETLRVLPGEIWF